MDVAANIRDTVERSQDNAKRLFFGGGDDDDDDTSSANLGNARAADPSSAAADDDGASSTGRNRASATGASSTANGASTASPTSTFSSIISSLLDPETSSSRTSSSSSSTSSSSSSTSSTPTTTSSSSTLETPSSTRTRPTRTAETTAAPSSTSVVAVTNPNSLATSIQLITSSAAPIASASSTSSHSSSSVGAGPIIGIVAAALAGVVIIAAAIGFLVKKYSKKSDPYDTNPFDADQFRRQSVMLPEGFGSDDGHEPSMTEHRNYGPGSGAGAGGSMNHGYDEMSYAGASASVLGGGAYASSYSHNDGGGPRPPTMFARHNDIHAAGMPTVGAALNTAPVPKLPAMAFGGGDPYSLAGVAGGMHNVSNPYAHLDRHGDAYHQYNNGAAPAAGLDRNGSDGSHRSQQQQQRNYGAPQSEAHETSGRPTSMEQGRSGTPDLPNVQQTYNLGSTTDDDGLEYREYMQHEGANNGRQSAGMNSLLDSYNSHAAGSTSPREQQRDYFFENPHSEGAAPGASSPPPPASLQVRNLTGNGQLHPAGHGQAGQRPISSVSSMQDDDAAYGGVY